MSRRATVLMQSLLPQLQLPDPWQQRIRAGLAHLSAKRRPPALPIGLDIADGVVRLLQLRTGADGLSIGGATRQVFACDRDACDEWRAAKPAVLAGLAEPGMVGERVVVSMPRSLVKYKAIRLGAAQTPAERVHVLAEEAKSAFGIDLSSGDYAAHFLESESLRRQEQVEGTLVVARQTDAAEFVSELTSWGLEVAAVDLEPMSLLRSVSRFGKREEDAREANVLIDVGSRATRVVIGRGQKMSFYKSIPIGGRTIAATSAAVLGLDESEAQLLMRAENTRGDHGTEENLVRRSIRNAVRSVASDLARELTLCIRYHSVTFQGRPPRVAHVVGGGATPLLVDRLQAAMDALLPIRLAPRNLLRIVPETLNGSASIENPLAWGKAFGLALQATAPGLTDHSRTGATRSEQAERDDRLSVAETKPIEMGVAA